MHFQIHISQTLRFFSFYCISNHNNVFAKYLDKVLTDFPETFSNIETAIGGISSVNDFEKKNLEVPRNTTTSKIGSQVVALL